MTPMQNRLSKSSAPRRSTPPLGQHFLRHRAIAERMVQAVGVAPGDTVLEIGPGTGKLTEVLLATGARVVAVEADATLIAPLRETFAQECASGALTIIAEDFRSYALDALPQGYIVVANIPYYATGAILRKLLTAAHQPARMALLMQREVAQRIARSAKGSLLSLSIAAYGNAEYAFTVARGAFSPPPNVDSAVLIVRDISRDAFASPAAEERLFTLLHAGFAHKRKQLGGNLERAGVVAASLPPQARAEDIPLDAWLAAAHERL